MSAMQMQAVGSQWQSPNNSRGKPLVSLTGGNSMRTQPGAAPQLTGTQRAMAREEQCWPRIIGGLTTREAGIVSTRSSTHATPGAPSFPLENRELFKILVKNYALPKPCLIHPLSLPPRAELQLAPVAKNNNSWERDVVLCTKLLEKIPLLS